MRLLIDGRPPSPKASASQAVTISQYTSPMRGLLPRRTLRFAAIAAACAFTATAAYAQFGRGGFFGFGAGRIAKPEDFDGRFHYCRVVYRQSPDGRDGSWRTDYPR